MTVRLLKRIGIWIAIVIAHTLAARIAQEVWLTNGNDAIEAMGVRGYINGAGAVLATLYALTALRSATARDESGSAQ